MLLTIKTTHQPTTVLGYLLHKNPHRHHRFSVSCGQAHVFFPRVDEEACLAALLLDINPIALIKKNKRRSSDGFSLKQYVNDRPYVASSFLSMAIAKVFGSAMKGECKEHAKLAETPLPLEVCIAALPCRGKEGKALLYDLFTPLGYEINIEEHLLDLTYPEWGYAQHYTLQIQKTCLLKELLSHLYVLIPVLDNEKHYWVAQAEIDKLLNYGRGWLSNHPKKEMIISRYLKRQHMLTSEALGRLLEEDVEKIEQREEKLSTYETDLEEGATLNQQRMLRVIEKLKSYHVKRIADLGCGDGLLLKFLLADPAFDYILGLDVSHRALERAKMKLKLDRQPPTQRKRIDLIQGSLNYTDRRLLGFDAITLIEVIEHLNPCKLDTLEYVVFGHSQPMLVVITTPNAEYNVKFDTLRPGEMRHQDHRFEWTREEFQAWAERVAKRYGYTTTFEPIGPIDAILGSPTQMGIFIKEGRRGDEKQ